MDEAHIEHSICFIEHEDLDPAEIHGALFGVVEEAFQTNVFGAWQVTQAFLPLLRRSDHPRLVNVSSEAGSLASMGGGAPAYAISKAALNALTRVLADEAIAFIRKPRDGPFFLNWWPFSVHYPMQAREEVIAKYRQRTTIKDPIYAAMIEDMDTAIGRFLKALDETGLREQTLVIFNSAIFIMFAYSFFKPATARDWRTFGAFSAFILPA